MTPLSLSDLFDTIRSESVFFSCVKSNHVTVFTRLGLILSNEHNNSTRGPKADAETMPQNRLFPLTDAFNAFCLDFLA